MPDPRTHQTVAERLDIQLERCPNPLHRQRRWFTLAGGLLPLLFVGIFLARRDHTIFLARPVAESHQHLQNDCQTCHRTPWQPLVRLASTSSTAKSVQDKDCQQCHDQRKDDHHVLAMAKGVPDCVDCHQEHRGTIRLTDQADASCVKCHAPFADHPPIALLRDWSLDPQPSASVAAAIEQLQEVAVFEPAGDSVNASRGHWVDKTHLKFSHPGHLAPLVPRWKAGTDETAAPQPVQLKCSDCHELDAAGQYMRPIVYEKHCQDCHPLRFSRKLELADGSDANDRAQSLPHEVPEIVHGVMRDRLIAYARRHPDEVLPLNSDRPSRLPNRTSSRAPTPKQEWDWVEEELGVLVDAIFRTPVRNDDLPTSDAAPPPDNACLKCHESADVPAGGVQSTAPGFAIAPPGIPARWLPKSNFRHDRHLKMECVTCHQVDGGSDVSAASTAALGSSTVRNIMMPSIASCQACHGATGGTRSSVRARQNCTECHSYHHVHLAKAADAPSPQ